MDEQDPDNGDEDSANVVRQKLVMRYHSTTTLDNRRADAILADATKILQTNDDTGDVACDVRLVRTGDVTEFSTGDGSIDSQAEFNEIMKLPGNIKLVDEINWCGRLIPNVIGCARPGKSLAVVPITQYQESILWSHEYGHTKGLEHRDGDNNAVMYGSVGRNRRRVNQVECDAFRK